MAFNLDSYKEPFWSKSGKFIRGRDPLGIQNSSISIYSKLLSGMTNLTLRLRYYGLYPWLLNQYKELPEGHELKESPHGQYTFIRRGELILAYLMANKFPDEQSVVGITYANKHLDEVKEKGYYDIALGADKLKGYQKGTLYWDYTSGALGQYYAGSLSALGLIEISNDYFHVTEELGTKLAEAYGRSIDDASSIFLKSILEGKLFEDDLNALERISLTKEYFSTDEANIYTELITNQDHFEGLLPHDQNSSLRKDTLSVFLNLKEKDGDDFEYDYLPEILYERVQEKGIYNVSEAEFGWYFYFLNELTHYCLETLFWGVLKEMERKTFSYQQFINHIKASVLEQGVYRAETVEEILEGIKKSTKDISFNAYLYEELDEVIKKDDTANAILKSILYLFNLYKDNKDHLDYLKDYAAKYQLLDKNGIASSVFDKYICSFSSYSFEKYLHEVIKLILNDHISIAYNKMGNGEKNLLKFIVEDNVLIHVETMSPNFTSPRLRTLFNFCTDLDWIDESEETITSKGKNILETISTHE